MLVEDTIRFLIKQRYKQSSIDQRFVQAVREYDMGYRIGEDREDIGKDEYISERLIDLIEDIDRE